MHITSRLRSGAGRLAWRLSSRTAFGSALLSIMLIGGGISPSAFAEGGTTAQPASTSRHATHPAPGAAHRPRQHRSSARHAPTPPAHPDRSGKPRRGTASYYGGPRFAGKTMADGTPMNPKADIAASKTLPLGTKARVTNLENGKSATVTIRDRGPYVAGRIVDVSPKVAEKLDMKEAGVAPVVVAPIAVPQADGSLKPGSGTVQDFGGHGPDETRTADARQPGRVVDRDSATGTSSEAPTASGTD